MEASLKFSPRVEAIRARIAKKRAEEAAKMPKPIEAPSQANPAVGDKPAN